MSQPERRGDDSICPCGADYNFTCRCTRDEISRFQQDICRRYAKLEKELKPLRDEARGCMVSIAGEHALREFRVSAPRILAICEVFDD